VTLDIIECSACRGTGAVERQIGGDGYDDRCCALADVECVCSECNGVGFVHVDGTKLRPQEVV
jgi:hypothetical protein